MVDGRPTVSQLVATRDSMRPHVVLYHSNFQDHTCRLLLSRVVGSSSCEHASSSAFMCEACRKNNSILHMPEGSRNFDNHRFFRSDIIVKRHFTKPKDLLSLQDQNRATELSPNISEMLERCLLWTGLQVMTQRIDHSDAQLRACKEHHVPGP